MRMGMRTLPLSLLVVLALPACSVKANFVTTDASYRPARGAGTPALFLESAPEAPYRAVGTIALSGVDDDEPEDALPAALAKGQAYGCDLLVEKSIHDRLVNGQAVAARAPLDDDDAPEEEGVPRGDHAYIGMAGAGPSVNVDLEAPSVNVDLGEARRHGRRELVCGVYVQPEPAVEQPAPVEPEAPAAPEAPVQPDPAGGLSPMEI